MSEQQAKPTEPQNIIETDINIKEQPKQKKTKAKKAKPVESQGQKAVRLMKQRAEESKKAADEFKANQAEYDTAVQLASQYNGNPENLSKDQIAIIKKHIPNILRKEHR